MSPRAAAWLTALVYSLWAAPASAHLVSTRFGELYSGMLHPLLALEHVVPWLGLGLLGGLVEQRSSRWALLVFPLCVLAGFLLAAFVPPSDVVAVTNLASFLILGTLVMLNLRLPHMVFLGIVVVVGLSHGFANGDTALTGNALMLYAGGVTLAAYLLVTLATACASAIADQPKWGAIAVRAAGSWIVAIGLVFGSFTMLGGDQGASEGSPSSSGVISPLPSASTITISRSR